MYANFYRRVDVVDEELSLSNESKRSILEGEAESFDEDNAAEVDAAMFSVLSGAKVGKEMLTLLLFLSSTSLSSSSKSSKSSSLVRVSVLAVDEVAPPPSPPRNNIGPNVRTANCITIWIFCSTS